MYIGTKDLRASIELILNGIAGEAHLLNSAAERADGLIMELESRLLKELVGFDVEVNLGFWLGYGRVGGGDWCITYRKDLTEARQTLLNASREARIEAVEYFPNLLKEIMARLGKCTVRLNLSE
jgi:hypothetical protein